MFSIDDEHQFLEEWKSTTEKADYKLGEAAFNHLFDKRKHLAKCYFHALTLGANSTQRSEKMNQVVKARAMTSHTLIEIDRVMSFLSMDNMDKHHAFHLKQMKQKEIQPVVSKALKHVTSYIGSIFGDMLAKSTTHELIGSSVEDQITWHEVKDYRKIHRCYALDNACYCTCLIPSQMGYPCSHVLRANQPHPFIIGQFHLRWHLSTVIPPSLYNTRDEEPDHLLDPDKLVGKTNRTRKPNRGENYK